MHARGYPEDSRVCRSTQFLWAIRPRGPIWGDHAWSPRTAGQLDGWTAGRLDSSPAFARQMPCSQRERRDVEGNRRWRTERLPVRATRQHAPTPLPVCARPDTPPDALRQGYSRGVSDGSLGDPPVSAAPDFLSIATTRYHVTQIYQVVTTHPCRS